MTIQLLKELNYETSALRSKSWDEFARAGRRRRWISCSRSATKSRARCVRCGRDSRSRRIGVRDDPAAFVGSDEAKRRFFFKIYTELENRIKIFASLPFDSLDRFALERRVREIGSVKPPEVQAAGGSMTPDLTPALVSRSLPDAVDFSRDGGRASRSERPFRA